VNLGQWQNNRDCTRTAGDENIDFTETAVTRRTGSTFYKTYRGCN